MLSRSGGFSKARLGRMRDVVAAHVKRGAVPGLGTIFRVASMTKPIVAVATMILVEECRLRLDDPVDRLLPELANRKVLRRLDAPLDDTVPANRPITVRDLLTFRLGFGIIMAPPDTYPIQRATCERGIGMGPPRAQSGPGPDEWMRRLAALPLMHQPGEPWMYDTGSDVLGVLIARATGQDLGSFESRPARRGAYPVAPVGRGHDHRQADAGSEGALRLRARLLGRPWLGLRGVRDHPARRRGRGSRALRPGRGPRHLLVDGSDGRADRDPHDPGPVDLSPGPDVHLDFWTKAYQAIDD